MPEKLSRTNVLLPLLSGSPIVVTKLKPMPSQSKFEGIDPEMPYRTMYFDLKPVIELLNPQPSEAESG
jgi:hypothetical protein